MYSETCLNLSCSKAETLLWRTDTFDPVCFLYAFLSRISKAVKRTLLQKDNIFSPQIKKHSALHGHKTFRNSRKMSICQFSQKEKFFYTSKQLFFCFFLFQFAVLKEFNTFDSKSFILSCSLQPTNNCFCATESAIDLQTILYPSMNYWF